MKAKIKKTPFFPKVRKVSCNAPKDTYAEQDAWLSRLKESPMFADLPMVVPSDINTKNLFGDRKYLLKQCRKYPALRKIFFPTKAELVDQCFNLDDTILSFLLPRLVHFKEHNMISTVPTEKQMSKIVRGFWIARNIDQLYQTGKQRREQDEAFALFIELLFTLWR